MCKCIYAFFVLINITKAEVVEVPNFLNYLLSEFVSLEKEICLQKFCWKAVIFSAVGKLGGLYLLEVISLLILFCLLLQCCP